MIDVSDAYESLERRFRRLDILKQAEGILHWDQSVFMPSRGASARGAQLAELKVIGHEIITDPEIECLLGEVDPTALDSGSRRMSGKCAVFGRMLTLCPQI